MFEFFFISKHAHVNVCNKTFSFNDKFNWGTNKFTKHKFLGPSCDIVKI